MVIVIICKVLLPTELNRIDRSYLYMEQGLYSLDGGNRPTVLVTPPLFYQLCHILSNINGWVSVHFMCITNLLKIYMQNMLNFD